MKINIILLNLTKFKQNNEDRLRIGYAFCDKESAGDSPKYKGYREFSIFTDNVKVFDEIKLDSLLKPCVAYLVEKKSQRDPLKSYKTIEKIEINGLSFNLV